jgi:hypothetical protein
VLFVVMFGCLWDYDTRGKVGGDFCFCVGWGGGGGGL